MRLPLAWYCAVFFGLAIMILTLAAPHWELERGVTASGAHHLFHAIKPPLGLKARLLIAVVAGLGTALTIFIAYLAFRLIRPRRPKHYFAAAPATSIEPVSATDYVPLTTRRPIFADQELGAPLMSDEALERGKAKENDAAASASVSNIVTSQPECADTVADGSDQDIQHGIGDAAHAHAEISRRDVAIDTPAPLVMVEPEAPKTWASADPDTVSPVYVPAHTSQTLAEMIARLEAGLATRSPTPPVPPKARVTPVDNISDEAPPMVAPLKVVEDSGLRPDDGLARLQDTFRTLGKLVSSAAR
jgi:hypothetical protein